MTKRKPATRGRIDRPGGYVNRTFSMSRAVVKGMSDRKDINWSGVIDSYLKVYLYDIEHGVPRHKGVE